MEAHFSLIVVYGFIIFFMWAMESINSIGDPKTTYDFTKNKKKENKDYSSFFKPKTSEEEVTEIKNDKKYDKSKGI